MDCLVKHALLVKEILKISVSNPTLRRKACVESKPANLISQYANDVRSVCIDKTSPIELCSTKRKSICNLEEQMAPRLIDYLNLIDCELELELILEPELEPIIRNQN